MSFPNYPKAIDEGLPNGFASSRGGAKVKWVVVHVAAGFYEGTIAWFNDRRAQANSHYLVGLDGRVCQFVDEKWSAWHSFPANEESVGIEHVDNLKNGSPGWMSAAEFEASARLTAYLLKKYGLTTAAIKRHNEVGNTSHNCPGPYFPMDRYKARVAEILKGGAVQPTKPPAQTKPDGDLYRVVAGQGEKDLRLAKQRGFDKAWMLGERVIVGSGHRGFAEAVQERAIDRGFRDAWLLAVDADAPEVAKDPRGGGMPEYVDKILDYLDGTLGGDYVAWVSGRFTAGPPAWVTGGRLPDAAAVRRGGAFCAAESLTLPLYVVGKQPPTPQDPEWEGGLLDYGRDYIDEKKLAVVYRPGMEARPGDVFIVKYTGPALKDQGHTWIVGRNGKMVQSDVPFGINNRRTLGESIRLFANGKTVYMIRREKLFA